MLPGWAMILLMFGLVVVFLALLRLIGQSGDKKKSTAAAVVSKRTETAQRSKIYQTPATVYVAVFRLDSGEELELFVEGADYAALKEGRRGRLTWRGKMFDSFWPDK